MKYLLTTLAILAAAASPQQQAPVLRQAGVAARINGQIITWDEVELKLATVPMDRRPDLRKQALRWLAQEELFLQEAKVYGIEVSESQVDADLEAERKKADMSMDEYLQSVNNQYGIGITEHRNNLKRQRTIALLMSRLATEPLRSPNPKLRLHLDFVSPEEMREYYDRHPEQFKAIRQVDIFFLSLQFQTPEEQAEKARLAASIRRRINEGSPLYVQALAHMDINRMPIREGKRMPMYQNLSFAEAPFSDEIKKLLYDTMKVGDLSEPVQDGNSVNLFFLKNKIEEKEKTFEEAQPYIRRQLELAKRRLNQELLLKDLVKRAFVEPPDLFN